MVQVVTTPQFNAWYGGLEDEDFLAVNRYVDLLEMQGVSLGHPYSSAIKGAKYALRELRVQASGRPLRVFYVFDPTRNAVLFVGADKTGDDRFYERMIPSAEKAYEEYLKP